MINNIIMSTKVEISDQLKAIGVEHDPKASKETLEALLESQQKPGQAAAPEAEAKPAAAHESKKTVVKDPMILRPIDLPLVVAPGDGVEWNAEQIEFAKTLNGFAYSKPEQWAKKKDKLVAQLEEIGTNPDLFYLLSGTSRDPHAARTEVNDTRIGQGGNH